MLKKVHFLFIPIVFWSHHISCQTIESPLIEIDTMNWWKKDFAKDILPGISWNSALEYINSKNIVPKQPVKIAVIDTDFDINHKAISPLLSTNTKEIKGNSIDDDNNGYVDDYLGWNFLGIKNQDSALVYVLMEETRILKEFDSISFHKFKRKNKIPYSFKDVKNSYDSTVSSLKGKIKPYKEIEPNYTFVIDTLRRLIKNKITLSSLENYTPPNDTILSYVQYAKYYYENDFPYDEFMEYLDFKEKSLNICMDLNYDIRALIGDKPECFDNSVYGNGVLGKNITLLEHGTAVSGVLAQAVYNSSGQKLDQNNTAIPIKLLPITFTGIGDFTDKDFYMAIKYAVDNGAKIINLSQGKSFTKNPRILKKGLDLAERKNVLVVMSSGNQSKDLDNNWRFPQTIPRLYKKEYSNLIIVGATTNMLGTNLIEEDSNYGESTVDIFAPGFQILTSIPNNQYDKRSGTSYATPIVSNVAALIWSLYPKLKAADIKKILMGSGSIYDGLVNLPRDESSKEPNTMLPFNKTSKSGKIINAFNAMQLAEEYSRQ